MSERTKSLLDPLPYLSSTVKIFTEFVEDMNQVITAKLKLNLTADQKSAVRDTTLAYRDALNYASLIAFDNGKSSNGAKLQKLVYNNLRSDFKLGAQMACNVPRQVSGTFKSLDPSENSQANIYKALRPVLADSVSTKKSVFDIVTDSLEQKNT